MLEPTRNGTIRTSTLAPAEEPELTALQPSMKLAELVPPPAKTRTKRGPQKNPRGSKGKGKAAVELAPVEKKPLTEEDFTALGRATHKAMQLGQSLPFYIESLKAEIAAFEKMV